MDSISSSTGLSWQMVLGDGLPLFAVAYRGTEAEIVVFKNNVLFEQLCSPGLTVSEPLQKELGLNSSVTIHSRVSTDKPFIKALFDAFVHHRNDHRELKYRKIAFSSATAKDAFP